MQEVRVEGLTKTFEGKTAVNGVSFCIEKGEIVAFLGPNGAGKTTTVNMLTGLLSPSSGSVFYQDQAFNPNKPGFKGRIGVVPQHNNVDRDLSVRQNLKVHGLLFNIPSGELNRNISSILKFTELEEHQNKTASKLSGGLKRRLVIARALLHNPEILFLDEPTTGLDASVRRTMWDFIRTINREQEKTVLLTTHYIEEAEMLAHRVLIMDRGQIVAEGSVESLKSRVGEIAVDVYEDGVTRTEFFTKKEEAIEIIEASIEARIRQTNLEDVYLSITGRRIEG